MKNARFTKRIICTESNAADRRHFRKRYQESYIVLESYKMLFTKTMQWLPQASKTILKSSTPCLTSKCRNFTHYPIDDTNFGLTDEQKQLRETIFNFAQKELAPHADAIDKQNNFPQLREFWKKLGEIGLLGITAR